MYYKCYINSLATDKERTENHQKSFYNFYLNIFEEFVIMISYQRLLSFAWNEFLISYDILLRLGNK